MLDVLKVVQELRGAGWKSPARQRPGKGLQMTGVTKGGGRCWGFIAKTHIAEYGHGMYAKKNRIGKFIILRGFGVKSVANEEAIQTCDVERLTQRGVDLVARGIRGFLDPRWGDVLAADSPGSELQNHRRHKLETRSRKKFSHGRKAER